MNAYSDDGTELEGVLTKEEEAKVVDAFHAFDKDASGSIDAEELRIVLEMMGKITTEEEVLYMIREADAQNGEIDLKAFKNIICKHKKREQSDAQQEDTLQAYISMGGDEDGGGCIDAEKLIKIIKEDFEMTIDIEKLIQDIDEDGSGEIEFDEFEKLLESKE